MQKAIDAGERSRHVDADDLIEVLLAVADELDPPATELVEEASACPNCSERRIDWLVWDEDGAVHCAQCGANYRPSGEEG